MSLTSPSPTLTSLVSHLSRLSTLLGPLLDQPFNTLLHSLESGSSQPPIPHGGTKPERLAKEEKRQLDGRLDSAKVQAATAYTICALVWVYLKSRGIDPRTHAIHSETERVLTYLRRIKALEDPSSSSGGAGISTSNAESSIAGKRSAVDQDAASRFIRAALSGEKVANGEGRHTRFEGEGEKGKGKGKGKDEAQEDEVEAEGKETKTFKDMAETEGKKKKRKAADPFEGYSTSKPPSSKSAKATKASSPSSVASPATATHGGRSSKEKSGKKKGKK